MKSIQITHCVGARPELDKWGLRGKRHPVPEFKKLRIYWKTKQNSKPFRNPSWINAEAQMHQPVRLGNLLQSSPLLWSAGDSEAQNLNLVHIMVQTSLHMLIWDRVVPQARGVASSGVGGSSRARVWGEGDKLFRFTWGCIRTHPNPPPGCRGEDWAAKLKTVLYSHPRTKLCCKWCEWCIN